jgi:hypothetical protein
MRGIAEDRRRIERFIYGYALGENDVHGTAQNRRVKIEGRNKTISGPSFSPYRLSASFRPFALTPAFSLA